PSLLKPRLLLKDGPLPVAVPVRLTLASQVVPVWRSRTKTSRTPLVSVTSTRSVARLVKATKRPSGGSLQPVEAPLALVVPKRLTLTRVVVRLHRSRTNTSVVLLESLLTRLSTVLVNTT